MEAPPVIASARPRSWWWLAVVLPVVAATIVIFLFNPTQNAFYPRCLLYLTTGLYCPGCGSLRCVHQLSHGHFLAALHDNLLLVLALPVIGVYGWRSARSWLKGEPLPRIILRPFWVAALVTVVILFTILRNIPAAPFNWLAPR
jgi:Protein of unknown function (DUF2752)